MRHPFVLLVLCVAFSMIAAVAALGEGTGPYGLVAYRVDASRPDNSGDGSTWALAKQTIQAAIDKAYADQLLTGAPAQIWVKEGTYSAPSNDPIVMVDGISLFGGFAGTETSRWARRWYEYETIIDGEGSDAVVTAANCTIDGFTIQNGEVGIVGTGTWISHNIIKDVDTCITTDGDSYIINNLLKGFSSYGAVGYSGQHVGNNTIDGAMDGVPEGYEGLLYSGQSVNNIITGCYAAQGVYSSTTSVLWANTYDIYYAYATGNPLFADQAGGDYRLGSPASPCIDHGTDTAWWLHPLLRTLGEEPSL